MSRKGHKDSYSYKVNVKLLNHVQSLLQIETGPDDSKSRRNALHLSAFHRFAIRGAKGYNYVDTSGMYIRPPHTQQPISSMGTAYTPLEKVSRPLCSGRQKEHKG